MTHLDLVPRRALMTALSLFSTALLVGSPSESAAQFRPPVSKAAEPSFIRNDGQWNNEAKFLHRSPGLDLWITGNGVVYDIFRIETIADPDRAATSNGALEGWREQDHLPRIRISRTPLRITFDGARDDARAYGGKKLEEHHNYFIGSDRSRWAGNVPLYSDVRIEGLYTGIDALFYLDGGRPRYDLVVAPGADPSAIGMTIQGATDIGVGRSGALVITTTLGSVEQRELFAYQLIDGRKQKISCRFVIGYGGKVGFDLGDYDRSKPLVIDPLVYSTYLGGSQSDFGIDIAVDGSRNAYFCGATTSADFPLVGATQTTIGGGYDVFVTKLTSRGTRAFATYLGGNGLSEQGTGIAVDANSNIYVTGNTNATDFPTRNPLQPQAGGAMDAFVVRLTSSGALFYSTYLGGSGNDFGYGVAVDRSNNVYLCGHTTSTNFPTRLPLQATSAGTTDGYITKLSSGGALAYSTYIGGNLHDRCYSIALDTARNIYVVGATRSSNFPLLAPAQGVIGGEDDLFVTKLTSAGTLSYSTYIGGAGTDVGAGIAVDASGTAYVTGESESLNYPTLNALQANNAGAFDVVFTKLRSNGTFEISTYLGGGTRNDHGHDIAVDGKGKIHITGRTGSSDFSAINPLQATNGGGDDLFVMKLANGGAVAYSTYLGGNTNDYGETIAVDANGTVYIGGTTFSSNFPVLRASQPAMNGIHDAFVVRLSDGPILELATPAPGTTWCGGETRQITWLSAGVTNIAIDISSNGGTNWSTIVPGTAASAELYSWEIPSNRPAGTNYRMRIRDLDNAAIADTIDASFTINAPPNPTITSPLAPVATAFSSVTITSTSTGTPIPTIRWEKSVDDLDYSPIPGETSSTLTLRAVTAAQHSRYYRAIYTNSCEVSKSPVVFLTVTRATATLVLSDLDHTYDGTSKAATAVTNPAGLTVDINYSLNGTPLRAPVNAGSYDVTATIRDSNWTGTISGTLVINKAAATISLGSLSHLFDGSTKAATAVTVPPGLRVDIAYAQTGTPVSAPTAPGSYDVSATINDSSYQGRASATLVIVGKTSAPDDQGEIATGMTARVVPNPLGTHGELHIEGIASGRLEATIHDVTGRTLKNYETIATGMEAVLPITIGELASGIYTVRITTTRGILIVRMQVVR